MLEAMEHSARARFETPLLPPGSDLMRFRPSSTFQERFTTLRGECWVIVSFSTTLICSELFK